MQYLSTIIVGTMCAAVFMVGAFQPVLANAATISDADVRTQAISVQMALVETLREHVKLLEMIIIQRLENRVAALQASL